MTKIRQIEIHKLTKKITMLKEMEEQKKLKNSKSSGLFSKISSSLNFFSNEQKSPNRARTPTIPHKPNKSFIEVITGFLGEPEDELAEHQNQIVHSGRRGRRQIRERPGARMEARAKRTRRPQRIFDDEYCNYGSSVRKLSKNNKLCTSQIDLKTTRDDEYYTEG